jgi:hypothetical protein
MPRRIDTGEPAPVDRRSNGGALALGAPLSASFMGLLLARGDAAAAGAGSDAAPAGSAAGRNAAPAGSGGDAGTGALSLAAMGLGISSAAAATLVGDDGVIDAAALTALREASAVGTEVPGRVVETPPVERGAAPESCRRYAGDRRRHHRLRQRGALRAAHYATDERACRTRIWATSATALIDRSPIYAIRGTTTRGMAARRRAGGVFGRSRDRPAVTGTSGSDISRQRRQRRDRCRGRAEHGSRRCRETT